MEKLSPKSDKEFNKFLSSTIHHKDISGVDFGKLEPLTNLLVIQGVEIGAGFSGYTIKEYKLLNYDPKNGLVQLEDLENRQLIELKLSSIGLPIYSINKFTGMPDLFEKTFLTLKDASEYMLNLKYICEIGEESFLLRALQNLRGKLNEK